MRDIYLEAIRRFEGFTPVARWDCAQNTNGYGTRAQAPGESISRQEAERRFRSAIDEAESIVNKYAPQLDEGAKAALTSLTFNTGDRWRNDGLGFAIRCHDISKAKELLLKYDKAGGHVVAGLSARRLNEASWFDVIPSKNSTVTQLCAQPRSSSDTTSNPASGLAGPQSGVNLATDHNPRLTVIDHSTMTISSLLLWLNTIFQSTDENKHSAIT